jgi:superfamily II DNA or RNA helicase
MANYNREKLARDLHRILKRTPRQTKYDLRKALAKLGWDIATSQINSVLYGYRDLFEHGGESLPVWRAIQTPVSKTRRTVPQKTPELGYYRGPSPREWQQEAIEAWQAAGRRGVIEAVTGTGKTTVGILAAADAAARGLRIMIVVPGLDLLDQWYRKLTKELPALSVGRLGGGHKDSLESHGIVVSTVQSACRWRMLPVGIPGLLVADEVHRYGAESFALALEDEFDERLGLTATYEREDKGIEHHLTPYFKPDKRQHRVNGEVVAHCDYARGLADGILAHFRVGLLGVNFTPNEQDEYQELDDQARLARGHLINTHGCPAEPFGEFMKAVTVLSEGNNNDPQGTGRARQYLNAFSKRRALLADCRHKLTALETLSRVLSAADRAIVFTETVQSAEQAANLLRDLGIYAEDYTSALSRNERKERLKDFRIGRTRVLAAPKVLDEGIDVPEADVGIIVAASRSRRQMIQRMGRIIRPKTDGRSATFFVLFVRETAEDPHLGAHSSFLSEMNDNADEIEYFPSDINPQQLLHWYRSL